MPQTIWARASRMISGRDRLPWLVISLAVLVGVLSAVQSGQFVLLGILTLIWVIGFARNWRFATIALIASVPFTGVPELVLRQPGWPVLLKDLLFTAPAYLGFFVALARGNPRLSSLPSGLLVAGFCFVAIVLLQAVHAAFSSPLVAILGLKVDLWYMPLAFIAGSLFTTLDHVTRFIRIIVSISALAAGSVVVGGILVYSGNARQLYDLYGPLASTVTQGFFGTQIGDLHVLRIPGIFPEFVQSFGFFVGMFPLAASVWLGDPDLRWRRIGFVVTVLIALAGLLSGSRSSWVWLPIQIVLIFLILGQNRSALALAVAASVLVVAAFLGPLLPDLFRFISSLSWYYLANWPFGELEKVIQAGNVISGHGVGTQTGAIRYIVPQGSIIGIGIEGWYAKTLYELGLFGLLAAIGTWILVLANMWTARSRVFSRHGRAYSGALFVVVLTTMLNLVKLPYIDLEPLDVYFWFFVGLAIALPRLGAGGLVMRDASGSHKPNSVHPTGLINSDVKRSSASTASTQF